MIIFLLLKFVYFDAGNFVKPVLNYSNTHFVQWLKHYAIFYPLLTWVLPYVLGKSKYVVVPGVCRTHKGRTLSRYSFYLPDSSLEQCKKKCDDTSSCGAVSYKAKWKACYGVSDMARTTSERHWACYAKHVQGNKACETTSGKSCQFPFKYRGKVYLSCTKAGNGDKNWCATKVDENKNYQKWENCDMPTCLGDPVKASDVSYKLSDIKNASNYDDLCYTCSKTLVGVDGNLEKYETYTTGYIETVIKVTKNYLGPKIQYLVESGLFKIHSGEKIEEVDFTLFGAEASGHFSATGAGYGAVVKLAGGSVSIFDLQIALGVSSEIGIVDDSLSAKVLGTGVKIGRQIQICAFDICFGVDFGKLG